MTESAEAIAVGAGSAGSGAGLSSAATTAGGRPTSTPTWYWASDTADSSAGIKASVKESCACARSVSNAVPRPASSRSLVSW